MLVFNIPDKYLFVKVGKNAILDPNLSVKDLGYLAVLELHKTNPKYENLTKGTILSFAEKNTQFLRLKKFGYITEHGQAASNKNFFNWNYDISSFDIRQNPYSVIYHHATGEISSYIKTDTSIVTALPSDKFKKVPKSLVLDFNISHNAKGLFMRMMCLKKNNTYSKSDIQSNVHMCSSTFNDAFKELKDSGYITLVKIPSGQNGMKYDFILNFIPAAEREITLNKNGEVIKSSFSFCPSRDVEKLTDSKTSNNIRNIINNNYKYNNLYKDSSKKGFFEEELIPVLNQIKENLSAPGNEDLIDELNHKLLCKFRNTPIDLADFVFRYRAVLEKYNRSNIKIIDFNAYTNAIVRNDFDFERVNISSQSKLKVKDLIDKPLNINKIEKISNSSVYHKYQHGNYNWDYENWECLHLHDSYDELSRNAEMVLGYSLIEEEKTNAPLIFRMVENKFRGLDKYYEYFAHSSVKPEFNYYINIDNLTERDIKDLNCIRSCRHNYKVFMDLVEKLKVNNPDIYNIFENFEADKSQFLENIDKKRCLVS